MRIIALSCPYNSYYVKVYKAVITSVVTMNRNVMTHCLIRTTSDSIHRTKFFSPNFNLQEESTESLSWDFVRCMMY